MPHFDRVDHIQLNYKIAQLSIIYSSTVSVVITTTACKDSIVEFVLVAIDINAFDLKHL